MPAPETPPITVDCIIHRPGAVTPVLLIERARPPQGFALPGGFVDPGERLAEAARREAFEETGLTVTLEHLLGCYSAPSRDPRGHTISAVFVASAEGTAVAGDDAAATQWRDSEGGDLTLAFDHDQVLRDYLAFMRRGERPPLGR